MTAQSNTPSVALTVAELDSALQIARMAWGADSPSLNRLLPFLEHARATLSAGVERDIQAEDELVSMLLADAIMLRRFVQKANAMERSIASATADTKRLDWLEEQVIDVIHTDAGRYIDVAGHSVRKTIDACMVSYEQKDQL